MKVAFACPDGTVTNVIVVADLAVLDDPAFDNVIAGQHVVPVEDGVLVGPGWGYDPDVDPPFTAPPAVDPPPIPPVVDPVSVAFAAIGTIAAQDGPTLDEKLAAIVDVLAQTAPTPPPA